MMWGDDLSAVNPPCVALSAFSVRRFYLMWGEGIIGYSARPGGQAVIFWSESILRFLAPDSPIEG
jgi:hypothetical protein